MSAFSNFVSDATPASASGFGVEGNAYATGEAWQDVGASGGMFGEFMDYGGGITPIHNQIAGAKMQEDYINKSADAEIQGINEALAAIEKQYGAGSAEYQQARTQALATIDQVHAGQMGNLDQMYQGQMGNLEQMYSPYRNYGADSIRSLEQLTNDPSSIRNTPGYQFGLDEARKATESSAAARGGVLSGRALQELQDRAQNYQDTFYGNEFNRRLGASQFGYGMDRDYMSGRNQALGEYTAGRNQASDRYAVHRQQALGRYASSLADLYTRRGDREADLYANRGMAESDRWSNKSAYTSWHEGQGAENAQMWMGAFAGMLGGMGNLGGGGGGGGGGNSGGGGNNRIRYGNQSSNNNDDSASNSNWAIV